MKYRIEIHNGNANLGTTGKSIAVQEVLNTVSNEFVAHYMHLQNPLIPEDAALMVLSSLGKTAASLVSEGMSVQVKDKQDVLLRIYGDIHIKGGNINLERARELSGNPSLTEQQMVEMASELVQKAGVTYRARCEAEQKLTDLVKKQDGLSVTRTGDIKEVAYVPASQGGTSDSISTDEGGQQQGGGNGNQGGGDDFGG